ncbi:hypothetical protein [Streptomyces cinnamoneus]|uniref:hypothetical protein n=1 Tax=Streptomyces sp. NPDC053079 TaxID=3365697 RepID=UPI000903650E
MTTDGYGQGIGAVRRPSAGNPWSAPVKPAAEQVTSRLRRLVADLPDWEPLPPGEIVVRRPGSGL